MGKIECLKMTENEGVISVVIVGIILCGVLFVCLIEFISNIWDEYKRYKRRRDIGKG